MAQLARIDAVNPFLRHQAIRIIDTLHAVGPADYASLLRVWISQNVMIISEPDEILKTPTRMLVEADAYGSASGDCDDVSTLAAALMTAIGLRARFRAINPAPDGSMSHVFTEYALPPGFHAWYPFDVTISGVPLFNVATSMLVFV